MNNSGIEFQERLITNEELAKFIVSLREQKGWTQEVLAEIANKSLRTIQRVESSQPSDVHTRRALAKAFDLDDIDFFNKPMIFPDFEKLRQEQEEIEKETITKSLRKILLGRELRELLESCHVFSFDQLQELTEDATKIFAEMQDFSKDYIDINSVYSASQKLEVNQYLQQLIDNLTQMEILIGAVTRQIQSNVGDDQDPISFDSLQVVIGSMNNFPETIRVPKKVKLSF